MATKDEVENVLTALAAGAQTYGQLSGDLIAGSAGSAAAGLIMAVVTLMKDRTPEQTKQLIYQMAQEPAERVDLSKLDQHIADKIAARKAREADEG